VQKALDTLQFVEKTQPIKANVKTRQVKFTVTDRSRFDLATIKEALKAQNFPDAKVIAGPS
jgi:hypothetical protein